MDKWHGPMELSMPVSQRDSGGKFWKGRLSPGWRMDGWSAERNRSWQPYSILLSDESECGSWAAGLTTVILFRPDLAWWCILPGTASCWRVTEGSNFFLLKLTPRWFWWLPTPDDRGSSAAVWKAPPITDPVNLLFILLIPCIIVRLVLLIGIFCTNFSQSTVVLGRWSVRAR